MTTNVRDEYYLLTEKLDELDDALRGNCSDIDCDKYIYKDLLKKKYKPVLKHSFSCMRGVRRDRDAVMRLLSARKFRPFRYESCDVCKKQCDKLSKKSGIVSFTRRSETHKGFFNWESVWAHTTCKKKVKIPEGWKKSWC